MNDLVLNSIFSSEQRVKLIRYFLLRQGERIDSEEMRKFLNISKKVSFKKELRNLKKIGIIIQKGSNFSLDSKFPLIQPLKALILFPSFWYKEKITKIIKNTGAIKLLVFAGILAGDEKYGDLDILIVGNKIKEKKIARIIEDMESDFGKEFNYLILNERDFKYRYSMFDRLIRGILDRQNHILIRRIDIKKLG